MRDLVILIVKVNVNNNIHQDPDQDCFDRPDAALTVVETGDTKLWVTDAMGTGKITTQVRQGVRVTIIDNLSSC